MQLGGQPRDLVQQLEDGVVDMIWTVPGFTPGRFMGVEGLELPFMNTGLSVSESPAAFNFVQKHLADNEFRGIKIIAINATDRALVHTTPQADPHAGGLARPAHPRRRALDRRGGDRARRHAGRHRRCPACTRRWPAARWTA